MPPRIKLKIKMPTMEFSCCEVFDKDLFRHS